MSGLSAQFEISADGQARLPYQWSLVNTVADPLSRLVGPLEENALCERASRMTGLSDFGDDAFRAPMRRVLSAYDGEAALTFIGRVAAWKHTLMLLTTRLQLVEARKRNPAIAAERIRRPIFITGLPRSGSTLLQRLLAQDPANRTPLTWEVMYPIADTGKNGADADDRVNRAERALRWLDRLVPEFRAIHSVGACNPQECIAITSYSFESPQFHTTHNLPSYEAWLTDRDPRSAYDFHRQFLQHLQWQRPTGRWVLKAPSHLFVLERILKTYPDACVIQTHRDPLKVIPSTSSLTAVLRRAFSSRVDPAEVGEEVTLRWAKGVNRGMALRGNPDFPAERVFDLPYAGFTRDPMESVRAIYAHFDLDLTAEAEAQMQRYLAGNPKNKFGEHRYTLSQFGVSRSDVLSRFRRYYEFFGIEPEPA